MTDSEISEAAGTYVRRRGHLSEVDFAGLRKSSIGVSAEMVENAVTCSVRVLGRQHAGRGRGGGREPVTRLYLAFGQSIVSALSSLPNARITPCGTQCDVSYP